VVYESKEVLISLSHERTMSDTPPQAERTREVQMVEAEEDGGARRRETKGLWSENGSAVYFRELSRQFSPYAIIDRWVKSFVSPCAC
jgi:hypothetical protein